MFLARKVYEIMKKYVSEEDAQVLAEIIEELERGKAARKAKKGEKVRVTVRGEVISEETAQVNLVRIE